ncbi:MAG: HAD family hydrolase [bacterium]|nr:HAD family hydrolase [bacterium]
MRSTRSPARTFRILRRSSSDPYPERCGLDGVFDAVVLGPSFGFEKPDPLAFETIARELDVDLSAMLHVGDDWDDIAGANASGVVSVFINRDGADPRFRRHANYEIRSLLDLESLVEQISRPT